MSQIPVHEPKQQTIDNRPCDKLCETCRDMLLSWEQHFIQTGRFETYESEHVSYRNSVADIEFESHKGCHLCSLLVGSFSDLEMTRLKSVMLNQASTQRGDQSGLFIGISSSTSYLEVNCSFQNPDIHLGRCWALLIPDPAFPKIPPGSIKIEDSTASDASWACVSSWLAQCTLSGTHKFCKKSTSPERPKRLLNIVSLDGGTSIRLREDDEIPADEQYITLSHCWGTLKLIQLTQATLPLFKNQVPIEHLSKTFRDAVTITQRLGVKWLWIDSLCIIQDSDEDWRIQSMKMQSIYNNSSLNISASASKDGSQGCFRKRDPLTFQPCKIAFNDLTYYATENRDLRVDLVNLHINSRAWVLQERCLAPRVLHYGDTRLFWECNEGIASEKSPSLISVRQPNPRVFSRMLSEANLTRIASGLEPDRMRILIAWGAIMNAYARCELTYESDKLIALMGLINQTSEALCDSNVAALWQKDIEFQLTWSTFLFGIRGEEGKAKRLSANIAPSWSWTSIHGRRLQPDTLALESLAAGCTAISHVKVAWSQTYSSERSTPTLNLTCSLLPVSISNEHEAEARGKEDYFTGQVTAWSRAEQHASPATIECEIDIYDEVKFLHATGEAWCVPLFSIVDDTSRCYSTRGIVVIRIQSEGQRVFRRVGRFNHEEYESEGRFFVSENGYLNSRSNPSFYDGTISGVTNGRVPISIFDRSLRFRLQTLFPDNLSSLADFIINDEIREYNVILH